MNFSAFIKTILILAALYGLNFFFKADLNSYYLQILCLIGINIIMAVSLNLINGITGQFSLGHAGFMAIGAYTSAAITFYLHGSALSLLSFLPPGAAQNLFFVAALLAGGLFAAAAGLLVGIPTLRLRGDYLAIATLGFGEIIRVVVLNLNFVGGARGLTGIPEYSDFFWIYAFALLTVLVVLNLVRSTKGKALLAIREDEIAAASVGIDTSRYKIIAFTLGAFFAGIGGGLFAHLITYLNTNSFGFLKSIEFVVMVVVGGMGSTLGVILSATVLTLLPELLRAFAEWRMIIYSVLIIEIMLLRSKAVKWKTLALTNAGLVGIAYLYARLGKSF